MSKAQLANENQRLKEIIDIVQKPAGEAFTMKPSLINMDSFIEAFHGGLKRLHYSLIDEIIIYEKIKEELIKDRAKDPKNIQLLLGIKTIKGMLLVWRKANDAIAWIITGLDKNTIKRLSHNNTRANLRDQNPGHVIEVLHALNSSPFNLAIWNDATSCVDVGDITLIEKKENRLTFIELKEGKINEAIQNAKKTGCTAAAYYLYKEFGDKALKQYERAIKQDIRYAQTLKILKENKGMDPVYKMDLAVTELKTPDEPYFAQLDELIEEAKYKKFSTRLIDDCLWTFAAYSEDYTRIEMAEDFSKAVVDSEGPEFKEWLKEFSLSKSPRPLHPIMELWTGLEFPETLPIFLFDISPINIHDIILRRVVVFYFISWQKFTILLKRHGLGFEWSTKKEGRRERSSSKNVKAFFVDDRILTITKGSKQFSVGPGIIKRMIYDCVRPQCLLYQISEFLDIAKNGQ